MKILLISGHGAGDIGACGNGCREADLTREVVNILAPKLKQYATVDVYPQNRNAFTDVNKGNLAINFANYNYVFEVHFNAGGGKGTEIYVTREETGTKVEQKIMDKLSKYFNVRGVKRKNFNVIAKAKRSGVSSALLETCFIDSSSDINTYQANKDGICNAICEGIVGGFGLTGATKTEEAKAYSLENIGSYVTISRLNVRSEPSTSSSVLTTLDEGSKQGIDYTQGNWGHLQSNAGWVCLDYCKKFSNANSGLYEITASALNVRKAPSTNSTKKVTLNRGSKQGIDFTCENWGHLSNDEGWICLDYCKKT